MGRCAKCPIELMQQNGASQVKLHQGTAAGEQLKKS